MEYQDRLQSLDVPVVYVEGSEYVDFPLLVERLGGASKLLPTRMRIDLQGTTAWVGLNDNRVNALSIFSLSSDVLANDTGVFIALKDCVPFFDKAFRLTFSYSLPERGTSVPSTISPFEAQPGQGGPTARTPRGRAIRQPSGGLNPRVASNPGGLMPDKQGEVVIRSILVDAGHGGYDSGVVSETGTAEKDIVLSIVRKIHVLLSDSETLSSAVTREQDVSFSVQQRATMSRNSNADAVISIHVGGAFASEMRGFAIFFPEPQRVERGSAGRLERKAADYSEASRELAERIEQSLLQGTSGTSRGVYAIPNALFKQSGRPSILIEVGCLTNPEDEASLLDQSFQATIAVAISNGIEAFNARLTEPEPLPLLSNESFKPKADAL